MSDVLYARKELIQCLQQEVLSMQDVRKIVNRNVCNTGLGPIEQAFPGKAFPLGAIHEFISPGLENVAATNGFITALLGRITPHKSACLWISHKQSIFPPAMKGFGIDPERIIFINTHVRKDLLWVIEEALKCYSVSAVVGELPELSFTESRRLQLAVEQSHVTGFIHRSKPRHENTVACVTRWKITPITSITVNGMPGVGVPRWRVVLTRVRNGKPGSWDIEWSDMEFKQITREVPGIAIIEERKAG